MLIEITNKLRLNVPPSLESSLIDRLTISNPKWLENERQGRWNGRTPKLLKFYEKEDRDLVIPRGLLAELAPEMPLIDKRTLKWGVPPFLFDGYLRPYQKEAVTAVKGHDFGTLVAPTGSGKTVIALWLIAYRHQTALVIVHTKELQDQWIEKAGTFLGMSPDEIGRIGDGHFEIGDRLTIALVQTLYKRAHDVAPYIGHLIVDECHRIPARTFTEAVSAFSSQFMLALTATNFRRDGLEKLIYWYAGPKVHEVDRDQLVDSGDVLQADVILRQTEFEPTCDPVEKYSAMLKELTEDPVRNALIALDIICEIERGQTCLVLSDRKAHCYNLQALLMNLGKWSEVLTSDVSKKGREKIVDSINKGQTKITIATSQLIGEGFDCKHLSTLFLTTPIKFSGRLIQYLGRVLRPADGKERATVYDYADPVGVLQGSLKARMRVYKKYKEERR